MYVSSVEEALSTAAESMVSLVMPAIASPESSEMLRDMDKILAIVYRDLESYAGMLLFIYP